MNGPVEYLDLDDLLDLARALLGDPAPVRDMGLLGSAAARPQTTAFGEDAYPDLLTKAAALLQSIVNNHALVDGNKRLGWLATAVFLELNGVASNSGTRRLLRHVIASATRTSTTSHPPCGDDSQLTRRS
jgi:death-on-curing protein